MLPRPQVAHVGRKLQLGVVHEGAGDGKPVPPGSVLGATQEEAAGSADVKPPPTALGSVLIRLDSTTLSSSPAGDLFCVLKCGPFWARTDALPSPAAGAPAPFNWEVKRGSSGRSLRHLRPACCRPASRPCRRSRPGR
jgi:hypothetical protein